jgi:hypothetical protein
LNTRYSASFARAATVTNEFALKGNMADVTPGIALDMAKSVAASNSGVRLAPCSVLGVCRGERR